jgi:uncharacterized protein (TIGR02996 family)
MPKLALPPVPAVHPERDALLAAIRDDPESDLPRLVYADWQDDHGQPEHAELIRVQCELRRSTGPKLVARRRELRGRVRELITAPPLRAMRRYWWGCLADVDRGFSMYHRVGYQMVAGPNDGPDTFATNRPPLPDVLPLDKVFALHVSFWDDPPPHFAADVFANPWAERAIALEFADCHVAPDSLRAAARAAYLTGVRDLKFWQGSVDAGELARMVLAPAAVLLCGLAVATDCRVTSGPARTPDKEAFAAALARIGRSRRATQLRAVYIDSPEEGSAVGRALLDGRFTGLTELRLSSRKYGNAVKAALRERFGDRLQWHQF